MLFFAKLLGEFFTKIKQPAIIGEILAGILLGPTVLGMISPNIFEWLFPKTGEIKTALDGITTIAVVLLLLVSGIEVDLSVVVKQSKKAAATGLMGIIIPFALGFGISYFLPGLMGIQNESMKFTFALFMGTALSISALPVIAKTLMDLNIFKTEIGLIIISAAMFNDIIGWLIFSIILGLIGVGSNNFLFHETLIYILLFVSITLLIGRKIIDKLIPLVQTKMSYPGGIINLILILGFLGATFTEYIGIHAIFGAFIMGLAIGDSVHLKERTREIIHQFITNIFAPLFFVSIGLTVNFIANFDFALVLLVLVLAFIGKVLGCGLGAYWSGANKNEALVIGFGMNSRGTMEIILGLLALRYGLIQETVFVALVIMALFTSIASAPMMSHFLKRKESFRLQDLLSPSNFIYSSAMDKETLLNELVNFAAPKVKIPAREILQKVIEREKQGATGIANYLALPHAKIKTNKPYVLTAKIKEGINFGSVDGINSRIVILLLTPENKNELQLQLLAETAKKFSNKKKIEELLSVDDKNIFIEMLKQM
jgi:Kef-type K+ transport system membrane component KefB